jgi:twinkle protein
MKLGISSVYGSAKATQEADNVLILQKDPTNENRKFVEVKKNRYDGTLGHCPLYYQIDSKRYSEDPGAKLPVKNNTPNAYAATNQYGASKNETGIPPQHFNTQRYASILADRDHL